jgi:hypothetical protein
MLSVRTIVLKQARYFENANVLNVLIMRIFDFWPVYLRFIKGCKRSKLDDLFIKWYTMINISFFDNHSRKSQYYHEWELRSKSIIQYSPSWSRHLNHPHRWTLFLTYFLNTYLLVKLIFFGLFCAPFCCSACTSQDQKHLIYYILKVAQLFDWCVFKFLVVAYITILFIIKKLSDLVIWKRFSIKELYELQFLGSCPSVTLCRLSISVIELWPGSHIRCVMVSIAV